MPKDKVIPLRLSEEELALVDELAKTAGLPRAEILRRSYRLLLSEYNRTGSLGVIFDQTAAPRFVENPAPYKTKAEEGEKTRKDSTKDGEPG